MGLGIVVVHYGDPTPTLACLDSVARDPSAVPRRVLVVDNSANLDPETLPGGVVHLPLPFNPGFGAGANRGVAVLEEAGPPLGAGGGWVILNGDVELLPGFLAAAAEVLAEGYGAAAGPLYLGHSGGALWYAGGEVRRLIGTVSQSRRPEDAERAREVSFLTGAALAVGCQAWADTGGFDPAFFLYNEDLDLCLRLGRAGYRLAFRPGMKAIHQLGGATGSREHSSLYLEHITRTRLLPYPSRLHRLWLAALHTGWVGVRALILLTREREGSATRVRALLRGHRAALASAWSGKE